MSKKSKNDIHQLKVKIIVSFSPDKLRWFMNQENERKKNLKKS